MRSPIPVRSPYKPGAIVVAAFERGGQMHYHSGRILRQASAFVSGAKEWEVHLYRPMRDAEPNTASMSIVLWEEELTVLASGPAPIHEVRILMPRTVTLKD